MRGRTVIISGGKLEEDFVLRLLKDRPYDCLIAAEGGAVFCLAHGIRPDLVVGDFDTVGEVVADRLEELKIATERFPSRKDDPDTAIALRKALRRRPAEVIVLGATGTRQDHFIANLALLGEAAMNRETADIRVLLMDANNRISVHTASFEVPAECGRYPYISFFAFSEEVTGLTLEGFSYPTDGRTLRRTEVIGTSNFITETPAHVRFTDGVLIMACAGDEET